MTFTIKFKPSLKSFQEVLHEKGYHLAMPPKWAMFWTVAPKGAITLKIADSILFNSASFFDAVVVFEKKSSRLVEGKFDLKKLSAEDMRKSALRYDKPEVVST